jgi:hypothetical protein
MLYKDFWSRGVQVGKVFWHLYVGLSCIGKFNHIGDFGGRLFPVDAWFGNEKDSGLSVFTLNIVAFSILWDDRFVRAKPKLDILEPDHWYDCLSVMNGISRVYSNTMSLPYM